MTVLVVGYESKKALKAAIGERLHYRAMGMDVLKMPGKNVVAHRPALRLYAKGREFFAEVTVDATGIILKVE